jgi:hypothetical protein
MKDVDARWIVEEASRLFADQSWGFLSFLAAAVAAVAAEAFEPVALDARPILLG